MAESDPNIIWDIAKFALLIAIGGGGLFVSYRIRKKLIWLNNTWCYVAEKFTGAACGSDDKLTVLVSGLYRDSDGSSQEHLRHALCEDNALEVLSTNQILSLNDGMTHADALAKAHATGAVWLQDRKADLLIWGERYPEKDLLRLRFTTRSNQGHKGTSYKFDDDFELPADFQADIGSALIAAVVTTASADISAAENTAEPLLLDRIPALERLIYSPPAGLNSDVLQPLRHQLMIAYRIVGGRQDDPAFLEKAIGLGQQIIDGPDIEPDTDEWASVKNELGNALSQLGSRADDPAHLKDAVAAYEDALRVYREDALPLQWAATKNNLGNALQELGSRADDPARLEDAVVAYEDALRVFTPEWTPYQYNLTVGNRDVAVARLKEIKKKK